MNIPKSWTFKQEEVAKSFDNHVREQLPWYEILSNLISLVAKHYLPDGGRAYDIGASTGNLGVLLKEEIAARGIDWIGIDNSEQMRSVYRAGGKLEICDALDFEYKPFDCAVLFLSLMFFPVDKRREWLKSIFEKMKVGGAIIIVDKQESCGGKISTALHRFVLSSKKQSGATAEQILEKELSLCGIQNPLSRNFFCDFPAIEIFRFGDFAAWVIEKREV